MDKVYFKYIMFGKKAKFFVILKFIFIFRRSLGRKYLEGIALLLRDTRSTE